MTILPAAVSTASKESDPSDNGSAGNGTDPDGNPSEPGAEATPVDPLEEAKAEAARLRDQLLRTAADFDNFRKRSRRELVEAERRGREDLLRELLPVFDNLERAVSHAEGATEVKPLAEGIALVIRQFADTLSKLGVERVSAVGTAFDPSVHEAIQHVETAEHPPGTVAMEVQAGYRMADRLLRPAMVFVAKPPASRAEAEASGPGDNSGVDGDSAESES
jgi:molecular chaperone GrpE